MTASSTSHLEHKSLSDETTHTCTLDKSPFTAERIEILKRFYAECTTESKAIMGQLHQLSDKLKNQSKLRLAELLPTLQLACEFRAKTSFLYDDLLDGFVIPEHRTLLTELPLTMCVEFLKLTDCSPEIKNAFLKLLWNAAGFWQEQVHAEVNEQSLVKNNENFLQLFKEIPNRSEQIKLLEIYLAIYKSSSIAMFKVYMEGKLTRPKELYELYPNQTENALKQLFNDIYVYFIKLNDAATTKKICDVFVKVATDAIAHYPTDEWLFTQATWESYGIEKTIQGFIQNVKDGTSLPKTLLNLDLTMPVNTQHTPEIPFCELEAKHLPLQRPVGSLTRILISSEDREKFANLLAKKQQLESVLRINTQNIQRIEEQVREKQLALAAQTFSQFSSEGSTISAAVNRETSESKVPCTTRPLTHEEAAAINEQHFQLALHASRVEHAQLQNDDEHDAQLQAALVASQREFDRANTFFGSSYSASRSSSSSSSSRDFLNHSSTTLSTPNVTTTPNIFNPPLTPRTPPTPPPTPCTPLTPLTPSTPVTPSAPRTPSPGRRTE